MLQDAKGDLTVNQHAEALDYWGKLFLLLNNGANVLEKKRDGYRGPHPVLLSRDLLS